MGSFVDNAAVYFFEQLDPDKTGRILAVDAATFLRSSGWCTFPHILLSSDLQVAALSPHNPYSISFNLSVFSSSRLRLSNLLNVSVANYLQCIIATPGIATSDLALIWDLSDRNKVGALDLLGLSTAIKLVALVQNGIQPTAENLK